MRDVLAPAQTEVLERFLTSNTLLAFDYDGTLAPIVPDPTRAFMRPQTRELLAAVARLYRVIIVSGRAQPDALRRLRGIGVFEVVGNHGIEPRLVSNRYAEAVQSWHPFLHHRLSGLEGVVVEDKIYSLAVHYRNASSPEAAHAAILAAGRSLPDVRIVGGKMVVNLIPSGAPHKGLAVERERQRLGFDAAIYVGDDETDEDVFALAHPTRLLGVRIGCSHDSAAPYFVADQGSIDELLQRCIDGRSGAEAVRGRTEA